MGEEGKGLFGWWSHRQRSNGGAAHGAGSVDMRQVKVPSRFLAVAQPNMEARQYPRLQHLKPGEECWIFTSDVFVVKGGGLLVRADASTWGDADGSSPIHVRMVDDGSLWLTVPSDFRPSWWADPASPCLTVSRLSVDDTVVASIASEVIYDLGSGHRGRDGRSHGDGPTDDRPTVHIPKGWGSGLS